MAVYYSVRNGMAREKLPECRAFIVCEKVITDRESGSKSIISMFDRIRVDGFPATQQYMMAYASLVCPEGTHIVRVKIRKEGSRKAQIIRPR